MAILEATLASTSVGAMVYVDSASTGKALHGLIHRVSVLGKAAAVSPIVAAPSAPTSPVCQSAMVKRTAKRGANSGNVFWGCSQYPACKGTRTA